MVVYQAQAVVDSLDDDDATGTARPVLVVTPRPTSPAAEATRPAVEPTSPVEAPTNPPITLRPSPTVNPDQDF